MIYYDMEKPHTLTGHAEWHAPLRFKTFKDTVNPELLTPAAQKLVESEKGVPVEIIQDDTLRIKVLDECGHACTFCHNEGTLVNPPQARDRVSVFLPTDDVAQRSPSDKPVFRGFYAAPVEPDEVFGSEVTKAKAALGLKEVHLTGGEPTQHRDLPGVVQALSNMGLAVKMTSNGETGARPYTDGRLASAGLRSVNISIFGSTPEEYAAVQPSRFGVKWAANKLLQSKEAIAAARESGVTVKSNCVMSSAEDEERIRRLIERAESEGFNLRILNNLGAGQISIAAIYNLLAGLNAEPTRRKLVAGASGAATYFRLPNGQELGYKQIRRARLAEACKGCELDKTGQCEEGFYGTRLYRKDGVLAGENPYQYGVCIQRMDLTLPSDDFYISGYPQAIQRLKKRDYEELSNLM